MTKFCIVILSYALLAVSVTNKAMAMPTDELLHTINAHVVRVQVALPNGRYGVGSGVVVAQDQVVTNCHVVANALAISVQSAGLNYDAVALKPDWHHDLCIVKVEGLQAPVASLGSSQQLQYEQAVFTVGYPSFSPAPASTFGFVKGLYPMDDSVIIRASSTFQLGESGGGMFDDAGNLVGIIALKSPGHHAYYYNLPVEWVQALLTQPEQAINSPSALPFWAEPQEKWPFFMRVVQPFLTEDWPALHEVARAWAKQEPNCAEAWFYLAAAEYATHDTTAAESHLHQVVLMNHSHSQALYYLGLIADAKGQRTEALNNVALLNRLDLTTANALKLAMGISAN